MTSAARSLLRLWPYVRPVRWRLLGAGVLAIAASCFALVMPLVLKWMVDVPVAHRDPAGVWLGGGLLLVLGVAEAAIFGVRRRLTARPLARVEARLRDDLFRHLQRLPMSFHDRHGSGQLLSRGTTDLQLLHTFLALPLVFLAVNAVTLLAGIAILLAQQWILGLVLLAPVVPLLALGLRFERRHGDVSRRAQDQSGDLTTMMQESVLGIRVTKGFGGDRDRFDRFRRAADRLRGTETHKARLVATLSALLTALPELAIGVAVVLGAIQVAEGGLTAGTLVAFVATVLVLRPAVESTAGLLAVSNEAATAADRIFEVLDLPAEPVSPSATMSTGRDDAAELVLERLEFGYPQGDPVLRGVDLRIAPGETVALVGGTGSGKSTLISLIPRLYEPTAGRILLDGTDIATLPPSEVRRQVAVAFEEPFLFSATVAENVLMGTELAQERALARALAIAQAAEFVEALPDGARTNVGEDGMRLSGGQRQRLALARAIVARPRFLVLDDPLSALDLHTEALIEAALRRVLATTSVLVVAARPSTALLADRVALLSGGRIAAVGTHHELLHTNPEYAALMTRP